MKRVQPVFELIYFFVSNRKSLHFVFDSVPTSQISLRVPLVQRVRRVERVLHQALFIAALATLSSRNILVFLEKAQNFRQSCKNSRL